MPTSEGVRSSWESAKRIKYDIRYQYFAGDLRPDFRTINRFRQENLDLLGIYFARIVAMCEESGLVDVSVLAIDGTKIRTSSSGRRTVSKKTLDKLAMRFHVGNCPISAEPIQREGAQDVIGMSFSLYHVTAPPSLS